jgi:hypothetical protein
MEEKKLETENEEVKEYPQQFYLAEVPSSFEQTIAFGDKLVNINQLVVEMANAMKEAGLLKLK